MINLRSKNRILALYRGKPESYDKVTKEEYKQLFYAVRLHIDSGNEEWNNAISLFLLNGARIFDRFLGFRPDYVDNDMYNMFCEFLKILRKLDSKLYTRSYILYLDEILWRIFRECNLSPYTEIMDAFLNTCEEEISKLLIPFEIPEEFKNRKDEIVSLIHDIRNRQIKSKIHTTLPFKLTNTDSTIIMKVDDVNVKVTITNYSQGCSLPGISIKEGTTMTVSGPSRWATTTCEVDIETDSFMDGLELRPSVSLQKKEDNRYWNAAYNFTYKVLSAIWMYSQQYEDIVASWPPLPNDIHYVEYSVLSGNKSYDGMYSTNPALVYNVNPLRKASQHYVIDEELPSWSVYAYHFAKTYARSGQLKESIFWLNVSVEALVEEFIQKVATTKDMLVEIAGEERKFDTAEEILSQQFPEMKGKVKWPNTIIHTSVFTKLKRAVRMSGLAGMQKEILGNFAKVNAKRNMLFHGNTADIGLVDVEKAFNAYLWLKERLLG